MCTCRAWALAVLLVGWALPGSSSSAPFLRACDPSAKRVAQPFKLPALKVQWDGWATSRIAASVAAILLSEKLGFTVELIEGGNPSQVYHSLSQGHVHLAFESWPESNRAEFEKFASPNATEADRIHAFSYADLFGHSGIFEACSRQSSDTDQYPKCSDKTMLDSPALLQDVLETEEGRAFFSPLPEEADRSFTEWVPSRCADKNCTVEIYHVDPEYDKELIEGMVEALGLPAKVVYIGAENMSRKVWSTYTKRAGALMYGYFPDINHHGISNLQLPRSKIQPDLDLKRQQIQKLAWPGLADHRGGDALAFAQEFALTKADYADLSALFDLFQDPQETACAWVQKNEDKWSKWIAFPERERAPLVCLPDFMSSGLCDVSYFMGWMAVLLQLGVTGAMFLLARILNRPPERPEDYRERLDQKLVVSGAARYVAAWWRQKQERRRLKKQVRAVGKLAPLSHTSSHRGNATPPGSRRRTKSLALEALMTQAKAYAAQAYNTKIARKDFLRATKNADVTAEEVNAELHQDTHSWWYAWALRWTGNFKTRVDFTTALYNVPIVLSHIRKYDNFARANQDPKMLMPPEGGDDRWIGDLSRSTLFSYMLFTTTDGVLPVILQCIGLGFFSGAISTTFYQIIRHETYMMDHTAWEQGVPTRAERSYVNAIEGIGTRAGSLVSAYAFFPTFLQMSYVVYAVGRWRGFQQMGYDVMGAISNTALLVGSSIINPACEKSKQLAWRVYRYLTVAHILGYRQHAPSPWFQELTLQDLIECGLLTREEGAAIEPAQNTMHELVCSWVSTEMFDGCEKGLLSKSLIVVMPTNIRGCIGGIKGNLLTNQPNLWAALMRLVSDLLILMFVIGNPAAHFMYESGSFQFYVVLYTTCQTIPYMCIHMLVRTLADPYKSHHDMFNTDSVIAWAERACFTNLRARFHSRDDSGSSGMMQQAAAALSELVSPMGEDLSYSRELSDCTDTHEGTEDIQKLRDIQRLVRAEIVVAPAPCPSEPTLFPSEITVLPSPVTDKRFSRSSFSYSFPEGIKGKTRPLKQASNLTAESAEGGGGGGCPDGGGGG